MMLLMISGQIVLIGWGVLLGMGLAQRVYAKQAHFWREEWRREYQKARALRKVKHVDTY